MNPFWMVAADLRKTLVSSLGVLILLALAFSTTIAINLLERGLREAGATSSQDFDLVIGGAGSRLDLVLAAVYLRTEEVLPLLPIEHLERLEADPRVKAVSPLVFADHYHGFPLVGVGSSFPSLRPSLVLTSGRWPQENFEVVAGASTGMSLGQTFQGSHGVAAQEGVEEHEHEEAHYTVVGVLGSTQTPWDRAFLTPYEGIWHLHEDPEDEAEHQEEHENHQVSAILVKPADFASAYALRTEYREPPTTAAFPGEVLAGLLTLFDQVKTVVSWLAWGLQGLVFVAVILSLLAGLPSKARWIGLLRSLGAGPLYVFLTLWIQTAVLFLVAGAIGALVGWAGAQTLAGYLADQSGLIIPLTWTVGEGGLLGAFSLVGLVGALIPSVLGYRSSVRRSLLNL